LAAVERFDAIGDSELRRTLLFVRAQSRAVSADEVARALDVPRTAARWRLEKLLAAGFLVAGFERRNGRSGPGAGRPAKTYTPAPETTTLEFPRRGYEVVLALLIRALPRRGRKAVLRDVGAVFGRELAIAATLRRGTAVRPALERLCRSLGKLGFHAALESLTPTEAVIRSATCPLRPLVVADAQAQAIDEEMWRRLVCTAVDAGRACRVGCRTHGCDRGDEPCRIVVTFAQS
jgi:predicted ArsR family transcriptional regulator